jgi:hypothetical protein
MLVSRWPEITRGKTCTYEAINFKFDAVVDAAGHLIVSRNGCKDYTFEHRLKSMTTLPVYVGMGATWTKIVLLMILKQPRKEGSGLTYVKIAAVTPYADICSFDYPDGTMDGRLTANRDKAIENNYLCFTFLGKGYAIIAFRHDIWMFDEHGRMHKFEGGSEDIEPDLPAAYHHDKGIIQYGNHQFDVNELIKDFEHVMPPPADEPLAVDMQPPEIERLTPPPDPFSDLMEVDLDDEHLIDPDDL